MSGSKCVVLLTIIIFAGCLTKDDGKTCDKKESLMIYNGVWFLYE